MSEAAAEWSPPGLRVGLSGRGGRAGLVAAAALVYLLILEVSATQLLAGSSWWGVGARPGPDGAWVIAWLEPNGLAWGAGVRPGDVLAAVDGGPPRDDAQINTATTLRILGEDRSAGQVIQRPAVSGSVAVKALSAAAMSLFFVLAGALVYLRAISRLQADIFVLACATATLSLVTVPAGTVGQPWAVRLTFIATLAVPTAFAAFFLVFPVERALRDALVAAVVLAIAVPPVIALALYVIALTGSVALFTWAQLAGYASMVLGYGLGLALLLNTYISRVTPRARQRLRIAVGGTLLGILPFLVLSVLPRALAASGHSAFGDKGYIVAPDITVLGTVLIPLSFGYAILKHQLIESDVAIQRGIVYAAITLVTTVCYLLTISVFQMAYRLATGRSSFATLVASALIVALIAEPIRRATQSWVERTFFSDIYAYRQLLGGAGSPPHSILSPEKLMPLLVGTITAALPVDRVALLVADRPGGTYRVRWDNRGPRSGDAALEAHHPALGRLAAGVGATILRAPLPLSLHPADSAAIAGQRAGDDRAAEALPLRARVLVPLRAGGEVVAILALGDRSDGELYSGSDLDFLNSASGRFAAALENALLHETVQRQADTDPLTGVHNHGSLLKRLSAEVGRARELGRPLAVLMMDVDSFKFYNDTYGHQAGDRVLTAVTDALLAALRPGDVAGRYGGDEFVCVLPNTGREEAGRVAEAIGQAVQQVVFRGDDAAISLSLTIGVGAMPEDGETPAQLIAAADVAMYGRKKQAAASAGTLPDVREVESAPLRALIAAVERKDGFVTAHSERAAHWAVRLAAALDQPERQQQVMRLAGLLHDVGKLGMPAHILNKMAPLTDGERKLIEQHIDLGVRLITDVPDQDEVREAVANHHERWDGRGYPHGRRGAAIPLGGRILAVADVYAAMTTDRPYRRRLTQCEAMQRLRDQAGRQLDPDLVAVFVGIASTGDGALRTDYTVSWPPPDGSAWAPLEPGAGAEPEPEPEA